MENLFEEKIIEVASGTKYVVIKQTIYDNKVYLLANELIDEETPSDTMAILRVDTKEENVLISLERDNVILNELSKRFAAIM